MTSPANSPREDALVRALAQLTPELRRHNTDVAGLSVTVGLQLRLEPHRLQLLAQAAVVHDIGKAYIPQAILDKPGPLDGDEWQAMKQHTIRGETLLLRVPGFTEVARIVRSSHENWDGTGYPDSLAGTQIPSEARIIAVCDAYDAITTDRPYRRKRGSCEAVHELERSAGCQFDPAVVIALSDLQKLHAGLRNETLCKEVVDSFRWRRFCRTVDGRVPDPSTLMKLTKRTESTLSKH